MASRPTPAASCKDCVDLGYKPVVHGQKRSAGKGKKRAAASDGGRGGSESGTIVTRTRSVPASSPVMRMMTTIDHDEPMPPAAIKVYPALLEPVAGTCIFGPSCQFIGNDSIQLKQCNVCLASNLIGRGRHSIVFAVAPHAHLCTARPISHQNR